MRTLTITSMKIQPDIYRLIKQGVKTHEVRDKPFHPDSMRLLGRDRDDETIRLAAINRNLFYRLFPNQPTLYAVTLVREASWRQVEQELGAGQ